MTRAHDSYVIMQLSFGILGSSVALAQAVRRRNSDGRCAAGGLFDLSESLDFDPSVVQIVEIAVHADAGPPILQVALLSGQAHCTGLERADASALAAAHAWVGDPVGAAVAKLPSVGLWATE